MQVDVQYAEEHSQPQLNQWFFLYTIRITNESDRTVQLLSRHWIITDAEGQVREVQGDGVVGVQPTLKPGEAFEYTSACPLPTPVGSMHGTYQMERPDGSSFDAVVAPFSLSEPMAFN